MSVARRAVPGPAYGLALGKVRAGFGILRIELRRSLCLRLCPFMVAALAWAVYDGLPAGIWLWTETVWSVKYSLILFGPLVGGLSVWTADRERRRGTVDLLATTPRAAAARDLAVWAATAFWCCFAYATVAAVFLLLTYLHATWGALDPGLILTGLIAVVTHSALGYAAGCYLPGRFVAPLFAIATYSVQGIAAFGLGSFGYLSPIGYDVAPTVFYDETPDILAPQTAWFLGFACAALAAIALKRRKQARSWVVLVAASVIAVLGAAMLVSMPEETVNAQGTPVPYEPLCKDSRIVVCVHPAYEVALVEADRTVNELAAPLVGVPGAPIRAEQRGDAYPSRLRNDGTLVFDVRGAFNRWNVNNGVTFRDYVEPELATALVTGPSGYVEDASVEAYNSGDPCRRSGGPPGEAQRAMAGWLIYHTGRYESTDSIAFMEAMGGRLCPKSAAAIERFDTLDASERRAWLREDYADLCSGRLTLEDLP